MSKRNLAALALLSLIALPLPAAGHGGVYRGPGATIGPGGANEGGPSSNTGGFADTDPAAWSQWWSFNRDRYLALRDAVFAGGPSETGFDDFFLGRGTSGRWGVGMRPDEALLHDQVVPALLAALERQKDVDIITGVLLALAKIGDHPDREPRIAKVLHEWVSHRNQEVHETATVALGVLAQPEAAPLLADLMLDRSAGREAAGRGSVPDRTQAFAAYGLGLIGYRAKAEAVRCFVVMNLAEAIALGDQPTRDRMIAAVIGMGLVRLAPSEGEPDPRSAPRVGESREGQLAFLFEHWQDRRLSARTKAYLAVPLARLSDGAHASWKQRIAASFTEVLSKRTKDQEVIQHGILLAAGLLADNDQDPEDQRLRNALTATIEDGGDRLSRHLALLALGRACGREGEGLAGSAPSDARTLLMRILSRGGTSQRPWAALAIGLLERGNVAAGHDPSEGLRLAMMDAYSKPGSPSEEGAIGTALGLMAERRATNALMERTQNGDENSRANAMIALGMMNAKEAIAVLGRFVSSVTYRPGLVREAAIAMALLGEKSAGPALVSRLRRSNKLFEQLAATWALGFVGDARAVPGLLEVLGNERENDTTRAYAAVALGMIGDKERFPWNSKIAADVLWWQAPPTLYDAMGGKGILDLL